LAWARIGPVRDADVLIERIRNQAASFDNASRAAVGTLIEVLVADRETARAEMLAALGSNRYPALLRWLAAAVSKPLPVATGSAIPASWPPPPVASQCVRSTVALQDLLGEHQDACVAQYRVRQLLDGLWATRQAQPAA
jgi:CHAD domain-containing protein